jgi:hypothetical protein
VIAAKAEEDAEKMKPFTICVDDSGPGNINKLYDQYRYFESIEQSLVKVF